MTCFRIGCFLLLYGMLPAAAVAANPQLQAPDIEKDCLTYDGRYESAPLMEVKPPAGELGVYLQKTPKACPTSGGCPQKSKAFLVEGDQVFVSKEKDGFRCAYYGTAGGQLIAGFLPSNSLTAAQEEMVLTPEFLNGAWEDSGDEVRFSSAGNGRVHAIGTAIWQGMGTTNEGQFDAESAVSGLEIVFHDDSCEVHVRRRGNYLLLDDNSQCGGMNVRFRDIYVHKKAKAK